MKCSECGTEIVPGEKFCGNCGAPVEGAEPAVENEQELPARDETVIAETPALPPLDPDEPPVPEADEYVPPPPPPPPPPVVPAQGRDSKKTWIIVAIVAVVLILCCCCVVILGGVFWEDIADAVEDIVRIVPTLIDASALV